MLHDENIRFLQKRINSLKKQLEECKLTSLKRKAKNLQLKQIIHRLKHTIAEL